MPPPAGRSGPDRGAGRQSRKPRASQLPNRYEVPYSAAGHNPNGGCRTRTRPLGRTGQLCPRPRYATGRLGHPPRPGPVRPGTPSTHYRRDRSGPALLPRRPGHLTTADPGLRAHRTDLPLPDLSLYPAHCRRPRGHACLRVQAHRQAPFPDMDRGLRFWRTAWQAGMPRWCTVGVRRQSSAPTATARPRAAMAWAADVLSLGR
jgi:hypothetical protein